MITRFRPGPLQALNLRGRFERDGCWHSNTTTMMGTGRWRGCGCRAQLEGEGRRAVGELVQRGAGTGHPWTQAVGGSPAAVARVAGFTPAGAKRACPATTSRVQEPAKSSSGRPPGGWCFCCASFMDLAQLGTGCKHCWSSGSSIQSGDAADAGQGCLESLSSVSGMAAASSWQYWAKRSSVSNVGRLALPRPRSRKSAGQGIAHRHG